VLLFSGGTHEISATPPVPLAQLGNEQLQPAVVNSHGSTSIAKVDESRRGSSGSGSSTGSCAIVENAEPEPLRISLDDAWKSVTESKPTLGRYSKHSCVVSLIALCTEHYVY